MPAPENRTLRNARREACIILGAWAAATVYCCTYYYLYGLIRPGRPLGRADMHPIWGIPSWFLFGVFLPWAVCGVFTLVFVGFFMKDDDLGSDHASELEAEIHEAGYHAE